MSPEIRIVECPRDAWQGMNKLIPSEVKAAYLRSLIDAGFRHIDAVSFVSPRAVPQMADSETVLTALGPVDGVEIIGIVVNRQGVERAVATGSVATVGFPYSLSPTFAMRNQRQTPDQSLAELTLAQRIAADSGLNTIAYISMAFGNPYGDDWNAERLISAVSSVRDAGVSTISLADTVGCAGPDRVKEIVAVCTRFAELEVGVHIHGLAENTEDMVMAAYDAGCRRFDSVIGGWGGCPFAQDRRIGNLPTERVLRALGMNGFVAEDSLADLLRRSAEITNSYE